MRMGQMRKKRAQFVTFITLFKDCDSAPSLKRVEL